MPATYRSKPSLRVPTLWSGRGNLSSRVPTGGVGTWRSHSALSPIPGRARRGGYAEATRPTGRPCPPANWTPPQQCSRRGKPWKKRILYGFCLISGSLPGPGRQHSGSNPLYSIFQYSFCILHFSILHQHRPQSPITSHQSPAPIPIAAVPRTCLTFDPNFPV